MYWHAVLMGSTLIIMMAAIAALETCLDMPASYPMMQSAGPLLGISESSVMELVLLAIVAEDEEGYLMGSTLNIAMAAMQICLGMHASYPMISECMTSAWPLYARCDGVGSIGNCGIGKKGFCMGSTLDLVMAAKETPMGMPASCQVILK